MPITFAVLGGDSRQRYLAEYLLYNGHNICTFRVAEMEDIGSWQDADVILLPVPALDAEGNIRGTDLRLSDLPACAAVFGGKLPPDAGTDLLLRETYAEANAVPTAEGAIQIAMENLPITLAGGKFLVAGAGRIGFCLGQKLAALGASVTVSARKLWDYARILAAGLRYDETGIWAAGLGDYDAVFNTVPTPIFTREQIEQTKPDCLFVELASAPYGIPAELCAACGRRYHLGAALPSKVAPKTAGEIIAKEVLSQLREHA